MRRFFAPLDDVLIERLFQPACNLISYRFGMLRSRIACLSLDLALLGWIASRTSGLSAAVTVRDGGLSCLRMTVLLIGLVALISLRTVFQRVGGKPDANPLRLSMLPHRAMILLMLGSRVAQLGDADFSTAADLAMLLFSTAALYLGACTELPPLRRNWRALAAAGAR